jgi:hypothetical protein
VLCTMRRKLGDVSPADPAGALATAHGGQPFFAYATNYLLDTDHVMIVAVVATGVRRVDAPSMPNRIPPTANINSWRKRLCSTSTMKNTLYQMQRELVACSWRPYVYRPQRCVWSKSIKQICGTLAVVNSDVAYEGD